MLRVLAQTPAFLNALARYTKERKKEMKKILALLIALTTLLTLFACTALPEEGDVTVLVETEEGEYEVYRVHLEDVENKTSGVVGIFEHLAERENNPLPSELDDTGYGAFVKSVGSLTPEGSEYISLYTSEEADFAVPSQWMPTVPEVEYEGITLKYSGVGLSSMTIKSGTVILCRLESYS